MLIQNWFLSIDQLRWLLDYHDWIRCYSCHMLSGNLPYDESDTEVIGIAFIRNPVDRFISSYNFQRAQNYRGGIAKEHDFDEFYSKALVNDVNPMWRNGQTFILGGSGTEDGLKVVSERLGKGQIVVLPMERFDESCMLLERLFPDDFQDCSYTRRNVSKQKAPVSEKQRANISQYMDIDLKLYSLANEYLDASLNRLFPDSTERQNYIDDFQHRCKSKKWRARLFYITRDFRGAVKAMYKKAKSASK